MLCYELAFNNLNKVNLLYSGHLMQKQSALLLCVLPIYCTAVNGVAKAWPLYTAYHIEDIHYISSHPWGGCNDIIRRKSTEIDSGQQSVKYLFRRQCGFRDPHFKVWEQEFANVVEIQDAEVIYIPEQKMLDGRIFPGNYWCAWPTKKFFKIWRAGYCSKEGFVGSKRF